MGSEILSLGEDRGSARSPLCAIAPVEADFAGSGFSSPSSARRFTAIVSLARHSAAIAQRLSTRNSHLGREALAEKEALKTPFITSRHNKVVALSLGSLRRENVSVEAGFGAMERTTAFWLEVSSIRFRASWTALRRPYAAALPAVVEAAIPAVPLPTISRSANERNRAQRTSTELGYRRRCQWVIQGTLQSAVGIGKR